MTGRECTRRELYGRECSGREVYGRECFGGEVCTVLSSLMGPLPPVIDEG